MSKIQDRPDNHLIATMLCISLEARRITNHLQAVAPENKSKLKRLQGEDAKIGANPRQWIETWIKMTRERLDKIEQLVSEVWPDKPQEENDEIEDS
jgi:hypothetical protein